jgi:hypothetical protein
LRVEQEGYDKIREELGFPRESEEKPEPVAV